MSRIASLGRAEMLLFWRNRTAAFTALVLPLSAIGVYSTMDGVAPDNVPANAFMLTGLLAFVVLFVVYYNLVTAYVARREDRVLKRLRTGEVRDVEILTGTAIPALVIAFAQTAVALAVGALVLDLPLPVNPIVLIVGLLAGVGLFVLLAAVSTAFTRTVELAQVSTTPIVIVCLLGSGAMVPLDTLPAPVAQIARFVPLEPVVELVRLGWVGSTGTAAPVGFGGAFVAAAVPLAILVGWIGLGLVGLRRWFRWEPRR